MTNRNEGPTEEQLDDARRILRADYYRHVRAMANELRERVSRGEISDYESLSDAIDQECDGDFYVIYTHASMQCLYVSRNEGAGIDELGVESFDFSSGVPWHQLAYFALRADLADAVSDIEFDDDTSVAGA